MREGGPWAGVMRNALEQLGCEPEGEAAIACAMAMRARKAVPGIDEQVGSLGQQRRAMPVVHHEGPGQHQSEAPGRRQLLGFMVVRPAGTDDTLDPPAVTGCNDTVRNAAARPIRRLARERGGER